VRPSDLGIGRLFDRIRDAVVVADATTGRIVLWNSAAETVFGYSAAEALGRSVEMLVPEQHRAGLAQYPATGHGALIESARPLELPALRKSGEEFTIELSLSPIDDELTDGRFALAIIRDVTERKRAEEARIQLAQAQAARAEAESAVRTRDEFLAAVSHDLKSPLTSIKATAQLMQRSLAQQPELDRAYLGGGLSHIEATVTRMTTMINELLDVVRLEVGQPLELEQRPTDLVALVRQVAAAHQATTTRHQIQVEADLPALVGTWDTFRLERVLDNLVSNAIKYSPTGGVIRLTLRPEEDVTGAWALVQVQDEGIGIPTRDLPHVFERFYRGGNAVGKTRGTGIGLAGACNIVQQHGGRIEVRSEEHTGTTFILRLPLKTALRP
jgi:PAS domain S-box-containing protein